jgi:putative membrane protein
LTTDESKPADGTAAQREDQLATRTLPERVRSAVASLLDSETAAALGEKSPNELAEIRTDLAVSRNLMAADRTLMAWIRTALSLNSFGFTIYKLLETFEESGASLPRQQSPRNIGLFLTGMGTFAMVMGAIEYRQTMKELRQLRSVKFARPTIIMGFLMACMGLFLFFSIVTKLF